MSPDTLRPARPRRRLINIAVGIFGELILTCGVILLLFVCYELWWTNVVADSKQGEAVQRFLQEFPVPLNPTPLADYGPPVASAAPGHGKTIGIMYIPRFGASYTRPIVEGIGPDVLDSLGLGHYPSTAMPGAVGNFVVAGHRQTHGAVLDNIHTLVPGDRIYVQTPEGYYIYVFRNNQIVLPDRSDVLLPVPTRPGTEPRESILTMTSCNPRFGSEERIIAYSVLESWQPVAAGPPAEIAAQVAKTRDRG